MSTRFGLKTRYDNFTSTQARAKEVALPTNHEGGQDEATMAKPLSASLPLTVDGVDKMYCQLVKIHAIAATQLAYCASWRRSDSTHSVVWARISPLKPIVMPSTVRLASSPPIDFSSQAPLWRQGWCDQPQDHREGHKGSAGTLTERRT
jgi:hypothetical protein